jgi:hypothetical protein
MAEDLSDSLLTSFTDHLSEQYGERGTPAREEFEESFDLFKLSVTQQETSSAT